MFKFKLNIVPHNTALAEDYNLLLHGACFC